MLIIGKLIIILLTPLLLVMGTMLAWKFSVFMLKQMFKKLDSEIDKLNQPQK